MFGKFHLFTKPSLNTVMFLWSRLKDEKSSDKNYSRMENPAFLFSHDSKSRATGACSKIWISIWLYHALWPTGQQE